MYFTTTYLSPVGTLTLCSNETKLLGLWIEGQKYFGGTIQENLMKKNDLTILENSKKWLDMYFSGNKPSLTDLSLAPMGGEFRQAVWKVLCSIPYGEVLTYREIGKQVAEHLGKNTMSAQAIGGAVGHNPISIIIPCHRVVGSNGSLTGYAGGIQNKIKLLKHEGVNISKLTIPKNGTAL